MPTILRFRNFRIVIYTADHLPPHVHVLGPGIEVIFYLHCASRTISLRKSENINTSERSQLEKFILDNMEVICNAWKDIHDNR